MDSSEKIIAFADKTVFSIKGLEVKGLNTEQGCRLTCRAIREDAETRSWSSFWEKSACPWM